MKPTITGLCIAGMHRSGTSALSRVLSFYGYRQASDQMPSMQDNPKGFWESLGCQQLNDQILGSLGGAWSDPGRIFNSYASTS